MQKFENDRTEHREKKMQKKETEKSVPNKTVINIGTFIHLITKTQ